MACYGSSERYLGTLAAAYGELELAELHLQRAIDYNRDMGAITWLAHSDYEYARALGAQGRAGDPAAQAALAEASDLAERIGMPALLGRIRGLRAGRTGGIAAAGRPVRRAKQRSCAWSRRAGRTGRSAARCTSASTRLQTTYAAFCVRPVARTAPKRQAMRTRAA